MSDAAGELSKRLNLLRLPQAVIECPTVSHVGDNPHDARGRTVDVEGASAQVNPANLAARTPVNARGQVDCARDFSLTEGLPDQRPIFLDKVLERQPQVPEGLHFGVTEYLVVP